jgi:hypothetical protein
VSQLGSNGSGSLRILDPEVATTVTLRTTELRTGEEECSLYLFVNQKSMVLIRYEGYRQIDEAYSVLDDLGIDRRV